MELARRRLHVAAVMVAVVTTAAGAMAEVQNEVSGRVVEVRVDNDVPRGMVCFDRDLSSVTCGTGAKRCLGFLTHTDKGRAVLSVALAAHASGRPVFARGLTSCEAYQNHAHDVLHINMR